MPRVTVLIVLVMTLAFACVYVPEQRARQAMRAASEEHHCPSTKVGLLRTVRWDINSYQVDLNVCGVSRTYVCVSRSRVAPGCSDCGHGCKDPGPRDECHELLKPLYEGTDDEIKERFRKQQ